MQFAHPKTCKKIKRQLLDLSQQFLCQEVLLAFKNHFTKLTNCTNGSLKSPKCSTTLDKQFKCNQFRFNMWKYLRTLKHFSASELARKTFLFDLSSLKVRKKLKRWSIPSKRYLARTDLTYRQRVSDCYINSLRQWFPTTAPGTTSASQAFLKCSPKWLKFTTVHALNEIWY